MATYKYGSGAVTAAKRVVIKDAFVQDGEVVAEVTQPAGTILAEVIVRFIGGVTLGSAGDIGYELGTTSSGDQLGTNADGFLDEGTAIAANTVYYLSKGAGAAGFTPDSTQDDTSGAAAVGYSDDERTLYFTTICANQTVTGDNEIELNFVFTHLV
jgi:hypothetical protein